MVGNLCLAERGHIGCTNHEQQPCNKRNAQAEAHA
jgi:hypothetical protein